jgi:DNA-binding response OmpR family regulator
VRILFADDNPDTREMFGLMFAMSGHETRMATNGAEALEWAQKEDFDITILDVEMPILSGLEALRILREKAPPVSFPIVMFTAYRDKETEQAAQQYGVREIIHKPILPTTFVQQIEAIVRECSLCTCNEPG